jgi:hypothetical protein
MHSKLSSYISTHYSRVVAELENNFTHLKEGGKQWMIKKPNQKKGKRQ